MNASKEFRAHQSAQLRASIQSARKSWHDLEKALTLYHAQERRADAFARAFLTAQPGFTKLWFDLLEWVLIMGALWYLHGKTDSKPVLVVFYMSLVIFAAFVPIAVGRTFMFLRFPFVKSVGLTILLSMGISAASGIGVFYLFHTVVFELAKHKE
jgi:hypothetical protein